MFRDFVATYRQGLHACYEEISLGELERFAEMLLSAYREGRRVFFLGNGGSATTASHMAVDFAKGTAVVGCRRLRAISLTDNMGLITAWANDGHFETVFEEQLSNLVEPFDIVVAISASGNSPNILRAVEFARKRGARTVGLIGFGGGKLRELVDVAISVSSRNYGQVEDMHLTIDHIVSQYLRLRIESEEANSNIRKRAGSYLKFLFSSPPSEGKRAAIFIDRDGVINERVENGYVLDWEQFRFRDGIKKAMSQLEVLKLPVIVVSNQACVGKGLLSAEDLEDITKRFVLELQESGVKIDAVYYCPHTIEENCCCRKPRSGLIEAAALEWGIDLARSVLIGDSDSDLQAASALGCPAVFVRSKHHETAESFVTPHTSGMLAVNSPSEIPQAVKSFLHPVEVSSNTEFE